MPIYEYECKNCHHTFDLLQKISDPPAKQCPVCFEASVVRLVSPSGFQLKGTGWYATDFKDKKTVSGQKKDGGTQGSAASSEKSTDKGGNSE